VLIFDAIDDLAFSLCFFNSLDVLEPEINLIDCFYFNSMLFGQKFFNLMFAFVLFSMFGSVFSL